MDFGHYSRLQQLQKRLWYFSYLKYPISSVYHLLTNSSQSITSVDQPSITYSHPCSGCLRCQPSLAEQYQTSQQPAKTSFFSRIYQSNRSNIKPSAAIPQSSPPVENPDCGVEYCLDTKQMPMEFHVKATNDEHSFQVKIDEEFQRFNYDETKPHSQLINVQRVRFHPNVDLIPKHMLIDHEKLDSIKLSDAINSSTEFRVELSDKPLKFIQINPQSSAMKKLTKNELEEDALEKTGIFLFPRHRSQPMPSS